MNSNLTFIWILLASFLVFSFVTHLVRQTPAWKRTVSFAKPDTYLLIIVAFYSILIAFLILRLCTVQDEANLNVQLEAETIYTAYNLAHYFPAPYSVGIQSQVKGYLSDIIDKNKRENDTEFPEYFSSSFEALHQLGSLKNEGVILNQFLYANEKLLRYRSERLQNQNAHLEPYLWVILLLGALIVFAGTLFIEIEHHLTHIFLSAALGSIIVCLLFTIYDLQNPFSGIWRIDSKPYQIVVERIQGR